MKKENHTVVLGICFAAQLLIGTSQPFGVSAGVLLWVLLISTVVQLLLFRFLQQRKFVDSPLFLAYLSLFLLFMAGYDLVKADRFYRAVTSGEFSFWWLTGCMLFLGWYAARCGRATVLRAALPVLALTLISLAVLAVTGSYRPENLLPVEMHSSLLPRVVVLFVEYTFTGELLLWFYWKEHACPVNGESATSCERFTGWPAAVILRFVLMALFAVLAEMKLGARFAQTPQVFGLLSLIGVGGSGACIGAVYHCIWLAALALRVGAVCVTLREADTALFPKLSAPARSAAEIVGLLIAAALWTGFWQQDCLLGISCCVMTGLIAVALMAPKERSTHATG